MRYHCVGTQWRFTVWRMYLLGTLMKTWFRVRLFTALHRIAWQKTLLLTAIGLTRWLSEHCYLVFYFCAVLSVARLHSKQLSIYGCIDNLVVPPIDNIFVCALRFKANLTISAADSDIFYKKIWKLNSVFSCILLLLHTNFKLHKIPVIKIWLKGRNVCSFTSAVVRFAVLLKFLELVWSYFWF